jgi:hypothetical protein
MSLIDENSNAEGGNGFFSSTASPLGEETKDGGGDQQAPNGNGAGLNRFLSRSKTDPGSRCRPCKMFSTTCLKKGNGP